MVGCTFVPPIHPFDLHTQPNNSSALKSNADFLSIAKRTLEMEAHAISELVDRIGSEFTGVVNCILEQGPLGGKVVLTGIGKSADIARKTVATLNSTGTPSAFLHAADALHGDLGLIGPEDVVIAVSKSGATAELIQLLPLLQARGIAMVAMVGQADSPVARAADHFLHVGVSQEACPHNLAPTTSSAAQLAMGDALAMALMEGRGFSSEDFARHHPGGSLGRRLLLRLKDLSPDQHRPHVSPSAPLREVLAGLTSGRVGAVAVIDHEGGEGPLLGIITDGDLRRALDGDSAHWNGLTAADLMQANPHCMPPDTLAVAALEHLEQERIHQIVVLDGHQFEGFIHLHHLMDAGIR